MGECWVLYECPVCGRHWTLVEGARLPDHQKRGCAYQGVGVRLSFTLAEAARPGGMKTRILEANRGEV